MSGAGGYWPRRTNGKLNDHATALALGLVAVLVLQ